MWYVNTYFSRHFQYRRARSSFNFLAVNGKCHLIHVFYPLHGLFRFSGVFLHHILSSDMPLDTLALQKGNIQLRRSSFSFLPGSFLCFTPFHRFFVRFIFGFSYIFLVFIITPPRYLSIANAALCPQFMASMTVAGPVIQSPPANTLKDVSRYFHLLQ